MDAIALPHAVPVPDPVEEEWHQPRPVRTGASRRPAATVIQVTAVGVGLMALLTLAAGLVVLLAALRTAAAERRFEAALMRSLGASRPRLQAVAVAELAVSGGVSGLLGGLAAAAGGYVAARQLFGLSYAFPWWIVVAPS